MKKNNYSLNTATYGTHCIISSLLKYGSNILDIGCNDGYMAKLFPRGNFYGIEYSSVSAKKAIKNGYLYVKTGDLNQYKKFRIKNKFQTIIFADILEHLHHPNKVLRYFVNHNLSNHGNVIISLPNVANFTVRVNLFFGKFNYTSSGILDKTHLHLYTKFTAKQLINGSKLKIISSHYSSNRFGRLINLFPFLGSLLGYNLIFLCKKI